MVGRALAQWGAQGNKREDLILSTKLSVYGSRGGGRARAVPGAPSSQRDEAVTPEGASDKLRCSAAPGAALLSFFSTLWSKNLTLSR